MAEDGDVGKMSQIKDFAFCMLHVICLTVVQCVNIPDLFMNFGKKIFLFAGTLQFESCLTDSTFVSNPRQHGIDWQFWNCWK